MNIALSYERNLLAIDIQIDIMNWIGTFFFFFTMGMATTSNEPESDLPQPQLPGGLVDCFQGLVKATFLAVSAFEPEPPGQAIQAFAQSIATHLRLEPVGWHEVESQVLPEYDTQEFIDSVLLRAGVYEKPLVGHVYPPLAQRIGSLFSLWTAMSNMLEQAAFDQEIFDRSVRLFFRGSAALWSTRLCSEASEAEIRMLALERGLFFRHRRHRGSTCPLEIQDLPLPERDFSTSGVPATTVMTPMNDTARQVEILQVRTPGDGLD